jgi:drug/metabolite transporter (DMT)-like permease
MVALPILAGAVLRILVGLLVDRVGAKNAGIIVQLVVITGLALAWIFGLPNYPATLLMGLVLGFAGASFAVALPQAGLVSARHARRCDGSRGCWKYRGGAGFKGEFGLSPVHGGEFAALCTFVGAKFTIIYPDLRLDYKVATHPNFGCRAVLKS